MQVMQVNIASKHASQHCLYIAEMHDCMLIVRTFSDYYMWKIHTSDTSYFIFSYFQMIYTYAIFSNFLYASWDVWIFIFSYFDIFYCSDFHIFRFFRFPDFQIFNFSDF